MISRLEEKSVSNRFYTIADRILEVETTEDWIGRMADTFLSGFYLDEIGATPHRSVDCRIRIVCGEPPPSIPDGMQMFVTRQGACHTDNESYFLDVNGSRIVVGPPVSRSVNVWFGNTPTALSPVARVNVLSYALHAALRRSGLYDLHSAGAVEPQSGRGILLVGDSNSGKSTLTLRLALAGWSYLSDDLILLDENSDGIYARGLRRIFSVSAATLTGCHIPRLEEALGTPVNSDPNKRRLDPTIIFPDGYAPLCKPQMIYFPEISDAAETRVEALGQAEVVMRLLQIYPWASFDTTAREYLRFLSRLVNQTRAYVLRAGRDVMADPAFAPAFLAAHLNDCIQ